MDKELAYDELILVDDLFKKQQTESNLESPKGVKARDNHKLWLQKNDGKSQKRW